MCVDVSTGDEWPAGTIVFHTTFFSGPNSVGSPVVAETPVPFGPRKRDQSEGAEVQTGVDAARAARPAASIAVRSPRPAVVVGCMREVYSSPVAFPGPGSRPCDPGPGSGRAAGG